MYNYQNIKNRIKRFLWAIIASIPYVFKTNKVKSNENIITYLIGEYPESYIDWLRRDKRLKKQRYINLHLPNTKRYICYFYKEFKEYEMGENLYVVEFANSYEGIKRYFEFIYKLNPTYLLIHNVILSGYIDYIMRIIMKKQTIFIPRGMNYYNDFIFRKNKNILNKIRGYINYFLLKQALQKSVFVNAPAFFALESELVAKKEVYISDYLYCQGAVSVQLNKDNKLLEELIDIKQKIMKFDKIIFMFTRVDMMKIDTTIDDYLSIESKLENSCLVIIGDGSALYYFKNKFNNKKNIFFTGWIDKNDAFAFIKDFDIMIAPHGGYSIIEMGFLGIPTIAYNYDIMSDLIYNRYNGYLVDKNSKEELKSAILEYFNKTNDERKEMKENIKQSFYNRFNLDVLEIEKKKIVYKLFGDEI